MVLEAIKAHFGAALMAFADLTCASWENFRLFDRLTVLMLVRPMLTGVDLEGGRLGGAGREGCLELGTGGEGKLLSRWGLELATQGGRLSARAHQFVCRSSDTRN